MKNALLWIVILLVAAAAAWYFSVRQDMAEIEQAEVITLPEPAPVEPRYPVEDIQLAAPEPELIEAPAPVDNLPPPEPPEPLPTLGESDAELIEQGSEWLGEETLNERFVTEFIISRLVATVDSLDSRRVAPPMIPIKPIPGKFAVLGEGEQAAISPENAARYTPYVDMIESVGTAQLLALYTRYYPLFQEAYLALGYEEVYFNDRLVEVLDHLLATPQPRGLIPVKQNEAVYEFVDEDLEALTAGQKALIRLGEDNGQRVRAQLQALRDGVAGGP